MKIEKKARPDQFKKVLEGKRTFDLRLADFICKPGDILVLREWDPVKHRYTGREITRKVTYVMHTKKIKYWPKEAVDKYGFQIIGLDLGNRK